jgi:hypothetical protein
MIGDGVLGEETGGAGSVGRFGEVEDRGGSVDSG